MSTETQRAEFEDFAIRIGAKFRNGGCWYLLSYYDELWRTWQAAQSSQAAEIEALRDLLNEVRTCFTRDDDLPDDLLPRIDAAMQTKEAS